jgi:hypothetical protein
MAKFNVVQKRRRAQIAENKRAIHGDPLTKKLKIKPQPHSVSGKRKRKLLKNWRRVCFPFLSVFFNYSQQLSLYSLDFCFFSCDYLQEQKEAVDKGLVTMQDVEMTFAQGFSSFFEFCVIWIFFMVNYSFKLKGLELVVMFFDILITISIDREKRSDDM